MTARSGVQPTNKRREQIVTKASWTRTTDGNWAVRVESSNGPVPALAGEVIGVRKRNGEVRNVRLGALLDVSADGRTAKYAPAPKAARGSEVQPMSERSETTYTVTVRVHNAAGEWVEWALPIESTDPALPRETSLDIARCAIHTHDVLTTGTRLSSPKTPARPARPSRARKTTKKAVA